MENSLENLYANIEALNVKSLHFITLRMHSIEMGTGKLSV